jgi:hypothetical protein
LDTVRDFEDLLDLFERHARACWIDLDSLIEIKSRIDHPRHREDVRVLRMVRERRERGE